MNHQIPAPFMGYHIALYTRKISGLDNQYLGYYKVFAKVPSDYWDHGHVARKCVGDVAPTNQAAMEHAESLAKLCILNLPSAGVSRSPSALRADEAALTKSDSLCAGCEFGDRALIGSKCSLSGTCEKSLGLSSRRLTGPFFV